jgi:hypothetical protein
MGDILREVERWRLEADELRAVAETLTNAVARDTLLDMADGYGRLADHMDLETRKRARVRHAR